MRRDHHPAQFSRSGSGLPIPRKGERGEVLEVVWDERTQAFERK
jgi:hypothetical protein